MDTFVLDSAMTVEDTAKSFSKRFTRTFFDTGNSASTSQIQFNLPSISNQNSFLSLKESTVTFPMVISASSTVDLDAAKSRMFSVKNGFQSLISSVSFSMDNQVIKNFDCTSENIPLTYKILSQSSALDKDNLHDSICFGKDDAESLSYTAGAGEINNNIHDFPGDLGDTLEDRQFNRALLNRMDVTAYDPASTRNALYTDIGNCIASRKSHVVVDSAKQVTQHIMVSLPLSYFAYDLVEQIPLVKGLFLKMNINIHTGTSSFNVAHVGKAVTAHTASTKNGQIPMQLSAVGQGWQTTADSVITCTANLLKGNDFGMTQAEFTGIFYEMKPEIEEQYLSTLPNKKITYTQLLHNEALNVGAGASINARVTASTSKMRWLLIHTSLATSVNGGATAKGAIGTGTISTANSVFTSSPATTMKGASITNLQVYIGGKPLYENAVMYSYDMYLNNIRGANSLNGGLELGLSSGLISKSDWESGYGYYFIDLSRVESDSFDLSSKPLEVKGINNTKCVCDYNFYLGYEADFTISTSTGRIEKE